MKGPFVRDAVIVEAVRTPVGRRNGALAGVHSADLSAVVLSALVERAGLDPSLVDDVIWGCVTQVGEQAFDIARTALLSAGWPDSVPGVTIDRQCGSSQQAIHFGAAGVIAGHYDFVVAGGRRGHEPGSLGSQHRRRRRPLRRSRFHGPVLNLAEPGPWCGDDRRAVGPVTDAAR